MNRASGDATLYILLSSIICGGFLWFSFFLFGREQTPILIPDRLSQIFYNANYLTMNLPPRFSTVLRTNLWRNVHFGVVWSSGGDDKITVKYDESSKGFFFKKPLIKTDFKRVVHYKWLIPQWNDYFGKIFKLAYNW